MRLHKDVMKVLVYLDWFKVTLITHAEESGRKYDELLEEMHNSQEDPSSEFDRDSVLFVKAMEKYLNEYPDFKESTNYNVIDKMFGARMKEILIKTENYQDEKFFPLVFLFGVGRWNDWSKVRGFEDLKAIDFTKLVRGGRVEGCGNPVYLQAYAQVFKSYWEY